MQSASLRIKDGGTERVGFKGSAYRGRIEMIRREYAGYTSTFEWGRVTNAIAAGEDPTPIMCEQIIDRVSELKINGKAWELTPESLRELRAREFETVIFCVHGKLDPEFSLEPDADNPDKFKETRYIPAEEREGN